jgi:hypothetical protein
VFFYGLFMDEAIVRASGADPQHVRRGRVDGFALLIGRRATLWPDPARHVYGMVMDLTRDEIERLYAPPDLRIYRAEAVLVREDGGETIAALCFNLDERPAAAERNAEYAGKLRDLAARLNFPLNYLDASDADH